IENSKGRFYWARAGAGTYGPFKVKGDQYDPETKTHTSFTRLGLALRLLAENGFNFDECDTNGDGYVMQTELSVLVIDNVARNTGADRSPIPFCFGPAGQHVQVCLNKMALADNRASLGTFAHELSHQLGTIEMYGDT